MMANNWKMKDQFLTWTIPDKHQSSVQHLCNTFLSQFISHRL